MGQVSDVGAPEAEGPATEPAASVAEKQIEAQIIRLEGVTDLDDETRDKVQRLYRRALDALRGAQDTEHKGQLYAQSLVSAPKRSARLRESLKQLKSSPAPELGLLSDATVKGLEQRPAKQQALHARLKDKLQDLAERYTLEQTLPSKARAEQTELRSRLAELDQQLVASAPADTHLLRAQAQHAFLDATRQAMLARDGLLEQELLSYGARSELLSAELDHTRAELAQAEARVNHLQGLLNKRREAEAAQVHEQAEQARREARGSHPVVKTFADADANAELSQRLTALVAHIERATRLREQTAGELKQLHTNFQTVRRQLATGRSSQFLGDLLLAQRKAFPDLPRLQHMLALHEQKIAEARLKRLRLESELQRLADLPAYLEQIMAKGLGPDVGEGERQQIRDQLRELAQHRQGLLQRLQRSYNKLLQVLIELEQDEHELVSTYAEFRQVLDRQLLWIPSLAPISLEWTTHLLNSLMWVLDADRWRQAVEALWWEAKAAPLLAWPTLLLFAGLLWARRRLARRLEVLAEQAREVIDASSYPTLRALFVTLLLALPWPLLLGMAGRLLRKPPGGLGVSGGAERCTAQAGWAD
jgi:potassium efflux system protein